MRARILAIASLLLIAATVPAVACPQNQFFFECSGCQGVPSTTLTGTVIHPSSDCTVVPWQSGQPCPTACYDMLHNRVEAHWAAGGTSRCYNGVAVRDTLLLIGPDGPALSFEGVLLVQCTIVNEGSAVAAFWTAGPIRTYSANTNEELVLPLSVVPGSRFEVFYGVTASNSSPAKTTGRSGADITGDLRFRGLPDGYYLVSCTGAVAPVPARNTSWGGVKAFYR